MPHTSPPRASALPLVLATIAVLLATGALVVSLVRESNREMTVSPPPPTTSPPTTAELTAVANEIFNDEADRELCQLIGPLMKESDQGARAFAAHSNGSVEQTNAIPDYRTFTRDMANRLQSILNAHAQHSRFLARKLQRFIDDTLLYSELDSVSDEIGINTWKMSLSDYGGPLSRCRALGVKW